tara:strand:- start:7683 stop:8084 length:402 start_codon:yes stop_codon:yes gene_type:complete
MALTLTISQKELQRQAAAALETKAYTIFLATNSGALTSESTYSSWFAVKAVGTGYANVTGTLAAGSYNATTGRWELPAVTATFTCTGDFYSFDTICVRIATETYLHSINVESPSVTLVSGQSKTYTITFAVDN